MIPHFHPRVRFALVGALAAAACPAIAAPSPDPLVRSPSWTVVSDETDDEFGSSAASAGDVNGDGYGDVIVGAPNYHRVGRAFLYLGSASGLTSPAAWTAKLDQPDEAFGFSVASAGDVNGDGYGDVVVGTPWYGASRGGRVSVYLGSSAGLTRRADWTADADQGGAYLGWSVACAGDVNGDGYSDVVVGADNYSAGYANEGRVYLFLGGSAGLDRSPAWTMDGGAANQYFGEAVASAGDVNGDGYSDVVVGTSSAGRVSLYLGSAAGLDSTAAWTVVGDQPFSFFGSSLASAGDVDGDGYDEVVVGAPAYEHGERSEGRAYVYFGSPSGLEADAAWIGEANLDTAQYGWSVGSAGDLNGDGYGDVVIGAPGYTGRQGGEGRLYVYLGRAERLALRARWTDDSDHVAACMGQSVGSAGDVNGDGALDILAGAPSCWFRPDEGRVYLYAGCPMPVDADGDGHPSCEDCDDADATIYPGASEHCDGVDNDCDVTIDDDASDAPKWYEDADADGYTDPGRYVRACEQPEGYLPGTDADDCDDRHAAVHPGAAEVCNGVDDDCDRTVDVDAVDASLWYADADGDRYADPAHTQASCSDPMGYIATAEPPDCDDDDATTYPGATDIPDDGIDQDCDGLDAIRQRPEDTGGKPGGDGCGCASTDAPGRSWGLLLLAILPALTAARAPPRVSRPRRAARAASPPPQAIA